MDIRSKVDTISTSIQQGICTLSDLLPDDEHKNAFANSLIMSVKVMAAQLIYTKESMEALSASSSMEICTLRAENAQLRSTLLQGVAPHQLLLTNSLVMDTEEISQERVKNEMNGKTTQELKTMILEEMAEHERKFNAEKERLVQNFALEKWGMRSEMQKISADIYMHDGVKWVDFYKRKYYDQLVIDHRTLEPYICPESGEPLTKSIIYQKERDDALAELITFKEELLVNGNNNNNSTTTTTTARLEGANDENVDAMKMFERKYKFLKAHLLENFYNDDLSGAFSETESERRDDDDDEEEEEELWDDELPLC
jgi:hypothetical protein